MINGTLWTPGDFPGGRYALLSKFDIFRVSLVVACVTAPKRDGDARIDVPLRLRIATKKNADVRSLPLPLSPPLVLSYAADVTWCASAYSAKFRSSPPSRLAPLYPFFRTSMTSSLLPHFGVTRSHFDPRRSIFVLLPLALSACRFLPRFCCILSPSRRSRSRSHPLCRRKNRESGRGRYTPVPTGAILSSQPFLRGSTAHTYAKIARKRERTREHEGVGRQRGRERKRAFIITLKLSPCKIIKTIRYKYRV